MLVKKVLIEQMSNQTNIGQTKVCRTNAGWTKVLSSIQSHFSKTFKFNHPLLKNISLRKQLLLNPRFIKGTNDFKRPGSGVTPKDLTQKTEKVKKRILYYRLNGFVSRVITHVVMQLIISRYWLLVSLCYFVLTEKKLKLLKNI